MKKTISMLLSVIFLTSICLSGHALDGDLEQALYIPTPVEIQEQYENIAMPQDQTRFIDLSEHVDPLLGVGIIASIAEDRGDLSVCSESSETIVNDIMPNFSTNDYLTVLENTEYTPSFRFMIMDMYSYLPIVDWQSRGQGPIVDTQQVDLALKEYIVPGNELSISAIASIQDKTVIDAAQLTDLMSSGSEDEQKVALRALCEIYPDLARAQVHAILSQGYHGSDVYRSAIRFMPRLMDETTDFTQAYVLSAVEEILAETEEYLVQLTCVKVLLDIDTPQVLELLQSASARLPADLVHYFVSHSNQSNAVALSRPEVRSGGMRKGNAIYRDGVLLGLEWHAGLVAHQNGPLYQNGQYVIHHSGSGVVKYDTFTAFRDGNNFIGERYKSGVSDTVYQNIFATADDLTTEGISYTGLALLTAFTSASGKIQPSDIWKIRCDGVVEYCYEYNGVRLQGGDGYWDISNAYASTQHDGVLMTPKTQYNCFNRTVEYD